MPAQGAASRAPPLQALALESGAQPGDLQVEQAGVGDVTSGLWGALWTAALGPLQVRAVPGPSGTASQKCRISGLPPMP